MSESSRRLLVAGDPPPVVVENPGGGSPLLLIGDHAGHAIPAALGDLGVSAAELRRHIALDIGVAGLGAALAPRLDAAFLHQRYSRLVIDCNRDPKHAASIPLESDGTAIPGNVELAPLASQARAAAVFQPYHDRIAAELDARAGAGRRTILVSLHSFTPVLGAAPRPWRFGVLHRGDSAFSRAVLAGLRARYGDEVGDNQPYAMDGTDYTVPHHAGSRGLDYLELEVRQDTIADPADQTAVADVLAAVLTAALASD
ncbi:MAG TPA: N-formylglutamate amidohydrolase [Caulobacteraceae bacterium]